MFVISRGRYYSIQNNLNLSSQIGCSTDPGTSVLPESSPLPPPFCTQKQVSGEGPPVLSGYEVHMRRLIGDPPVFIMFIHMVLRSCFALMFL